MTDAPKEPALDPYKDIMGIDLTPERLDQNLQAFADILTAIRKLRELDLTEVHPAVIFDPTKGYGDETAS
jgi:putative NADH-flavin reductase